MLIIFSREILKGIEAFKGDAIYGYGTLSTWLGKKKSAFIILFINSLAYLPLVVLFQLYDLKTISTLFMAIILLINIPIYFKLYRDDSSKNAQMIHILYKVFLLLIICLVVFIPN